MVVHKDLGHYNLKLSKKGVPYGVGGERWTCDPRVSGSSPGAGRQLEKVVNLDENSWTPTKII